jgi:hypothetical protein
MEIIFDSNVVRAQEHCLAFVNNVEVLVESCALPLSIPLTFTHHAPLNMLLMS